LKPRIQIRPCQLRFDKDGQKTVIVEGLLPLWKTHYLVVKVTISLLFPLKYESLEIFETKWGAEQYAQSVCEANDYQMYDPKTDYIDWIAKA